MLTSPINHATLKFLRRPEAMVVHQCSASQRLSAENVISTFSDGLVQNFSKAWFKIGQWHRAKITAYSQSYTNIQTY